MIDYETIYEAGCDAVPIDERNGSDMIRAAGIAAVVAAVKRDALEEAAKVAQEHGEAYGATADRLFAEGEWADSSRYSNYASGLRMASAAIRKATQ
ncbi:hypothetical protein E3T46_17500 [Cryobacterium sp. Hh11]|uniref:hypothetical protein n=1 Tax=Cryobacterium sp. Hh11 TaxID=2555868 RepID=UPI00106BC1E7|nr:hypothetical protein [Cryobacterium sp. Hh11]TFD47587.1 hypothetical protein E3T46_17500 [Cryobacterium sp. Hh11]